MDEQMRDQIAAIKKWLYARDWRTWIGHGLLGFIIMAIGLMVGFGVNAAVWAVFVAFVYRELDDLLKWWGADKETRRPFGDKLKDGFLDLWSPLAGAVIAAVLFG